MIRLLLLSIILPVFATCQQPAGSTQTNPSARERDIQPDNQNQYATIGKIPLPAGYQRVPASPHSFAAFLREIPLKKSRTVYLYNGQPKINQDAQFAVLDMSIGKEDLQQCADAVMRIRAEYLYAENKNLEIKFTDNANVVYGFSPNGDRREFDQYMKKVFAHCGTLSLEQQLKKRAAIEEISIGDVLIKGGSPGHAMLVVDMAIDKEGKKIVLLSQGYMPAQDIHIVKNPNYGNLSPWYKVENEMDIITPEWTFKSSQLRHW